MDISVFDSLEAYYNRAIDSWLLTNPRLSVTTYEAATFVGVAHEKAIKSEHIEAGFKKSDIYPFDQGALTEDGF